MNNMGLRGRIDHSLSIDSSTGSNLYLCSSRLPGSSLSFRALRYKKKNSILLIELELFIKFNRFYLVLELLVGLSLVAYCRFWSRYMHEDSATYVDGVYFTPKLGGIGCIDISRSLIKLTDFLSRVHLTEELDGRDLLRSTQ